MTDHASRVCSCGATLSASSTPAHAAEYVAARFDEVHTGDGHHPATLVEAARARRTWRAGRTIEDPS